MVAARNDFLDSPPRERPHAFVGQWVLDRVSGLIDSSVSPAVQHLVIDATALHVELHDARARALHTMQAELNGEAVDCILGQEKYSAQALLEADVLVWELEHQAPQGCSRVRRVMHPSKQGSQLVVERVDLNPQGTPVGLRTEYWTRTAQSASEPSEHP